MEIENEYIYNKEIIENFYRLNIYTKKFKIILTLLIAIFILSVITYHGNISGPMILLIVILALIILAKTQPPKLAERTYDRMMEQSNHQETKIHLQVTEKEILLENNATNNKEHYDLSNVKNILENKTLLIVVTKTKMGIVFKKDSFTKGTVEELKERIKQAKEKDQ